MFPTDEQIIALHRKYASDETTFNLIFTHSKIVAEIAAQLLETKNQNDIDKKFIKVASMLHDIGAYKMFANGSRTDEDYIRHGIEGQKILESENFDTRLCRIASHHTGVGIKKEQIIKNNLPLPHEDFIAESSEEELIMYADKFHSKTPKFNSCESYLQHASKFGEENVNEYKRLVKKFGIPDLDHLSQKYHHPLI